MISLYFNTDFTARWVEIRVSPKGIVKIGEKEFIVKNKKPSLLFGTRRTLPFMKRKEEAIPFYVFKHDKEEPIDISELEASGVDPAVIGKMIDLSAYETFMQYKPKTDKKLLIFISLISLIIGIVITLVLVLTKIVRL